MTVGNRRGMRRPSPQSGCGPHRTSRWAQQRAEQPRSLENRIGLTYVNPTRMSVDTPTSLSEGSLRAGETTQTPGKNEKRIAGLDGLRALSIALVCLSHVQTSPGFPAHLGFF